MKLTFVLSGNAGEPTNVEVISGNPMLRDASIENVKTWKFRNSSAEGKYETTLDYRLPFVRSGKRSPLNRSTASKSPLACRFIGNRDYCKIQWLPRNLWRQFLGSHSPLHLKSPQQSAYGRNLMNSWLEFPAALHFAAAARGLSTA